MFSMRATLKSLLLPCLAIILTLDLYGCCLAESINRIDTPISRTIALITKENPTNYFRWNIKIRYDANGQQWAPASCDDAINEVSELLPGEFLSILAKNVPSSKISSWAERLRDPAYVSEWQERADQAVESQYQGEEGFLDSVQYYIQRKWVRGSPPGREKFIRSCQNIFGENNEHIWYAIIFSAVTVK